MHFLTWPAKVTETNDHSPIEGSLPQKLRLLDDRIKFSSPEPGLNVSANLTFNTMPYMMSKEISGGIFGVIELQSKSSCLGEGFIRGHCRQSRMR